MDKLFPIVILAGGLATRLGSLTKTIPKSLILVNEEPFIAHQLRLLKNQGFEKVILCIGYLGNLIQAYIKDGKQFGLSVTYSSDGQQLLGTGGAICNALPLLEDNFFVLYGDSYLMIDYKKVQKFFEKQYKPALMTIFKNNNNGDISNIEFSNNEIVKYDQKNKTTKMTHIDYGLSVVKKSIFLTRCPFFDLSELYKKLVMEKQLASFVVSNKFYEIGSVNGLNEFERFIKKKDVQYES